MPRRRCVGCGRVAAKSELLRLATAACGEERATLAVIDLSGTAPGRGAYLCRAGEAQAPAPECVALALRRRAIPRALRAPVALDPKIVESVSR